jgi:hypothetical protein
MRPAVKARTKPEFRMWLKPGASELHQLLAVSAKRPREITISSRVSACSLLPTAYFRGNFTNSLRTFYSKITAAGIQWLWRFKTITSVSQAEIRMLLTSFITMLCTAGTVFYLRFLLALCKEYNSHISRDRRPRPPRLRLEKLHVTPQPPKNFRNRAARQITEIPLYTHARWRRDSI